MLSLGIHLIITISHVIGVVNHNNFNDTEIMDFFGTKTFDFSTVKLQDRKNRYHKEGCLEHLTSDTFC